MKIGVIGAGMLGSRLAGALSKAGHQVKLANSRGPETIAELCSDIGAQAVTVREAVQDVEIIAISIPLPAVQDLPKELFDGVPESAIIVDTGNYYPGLRDRRIEEIEAGLPESAWVSRAIGRPVVKAFNSISFTSLAGAGRPSGEPGRIALPVAGDDAEAKDVMMRLLDEIGFDGVDAGPLQESWRQQPGTPVYCTDLDREHVVEALQMADRARAPERRDRFVEEMLKLLRQQSADADLISLGRRIYGAPA